MYLLSTDQKVVLLRLARRSVEAAVRNAAIEPAEAPAALQFPAGAFVSLHKQGRLRGCVGYVQPAYSLYRTVFEAAMGAAIQDFRFQPVRPAELPEIAIEISVLSQLRELAPEDVQVALHGLLISQGRARGLLLPQVAVAQGWERERFLEETCRKAGLPLDAWRCGAKIEAFTAEVFHERLLESQQRQLALAATPAPPNHPEQLLPGQT
ncbi:MAG: AmmeMemoRadiSam system protein A [Acidobacteria bacterium]|nr:AmmeMemoRadiSam system protein A [Acidobacteriota bacterium]